METTTKNAWQDCYHGRNRPLFTTLNWKRGLILKGVVGGNLGKFCVV